MSQHHDIVLKDEDIIIPEGHKLAGVPNKALIVGGVALLATFGLGATDLGHFYFSYLTAFMFWLAVALGALGFVVIHHAVRAGWSVVVRRLAEHLMTGLPVLALLFLPILASLSSSVLPTRGRYSALSDMPGTAAPGRSACVSTSSGC